ncbi:hypothetical protein F511_04234 [Dorcoceras hygrometricum]|uniref:Uncharacterized protein n=1 Tax=Dorcoceras hygrometricum TaxID=472368 RepID=A0A2Z7BCH4_9LAMI|nr:hypothetical protein F511_04234 [Dorcoceras hygrometricum]
MRFKGCSGGGKYRQSGPRTETGFLHQPALEGLTRSAWTDSPRQDWPEQIPAKRRRRRWRRMAAAAYREERGAAAKELAEYPCGNLESSTWVTLNGSGIQLAVGPQPLWLRNQNSGLAQRIMVRASSNIAHDPLGITDSACKNQLVVVSVQYGPFNPYIPIRSTTIGKSRVAIDPIAMHTSWRSNSDIASVARLGLKDAGIDQLNFHSVQLDYLELLQMGNTDPNITKSGNKYEVKPQYEELSKQLGGRHSNPVVTTPTIALDFSNMTQQSASHNVAPNQTTKNRAQTTRNAHPKAHSRRRTHAQTFLKSFEVQQLRVSTSSAIQLLKWVENERAKQGEFSATKISKNKGWMRRKSREEMSRASAETNSQRSKMLTNTRHFLAQSHATRDVCQQQLQFAPKPADFHASR